MSTRLRVVLRYPNGGAVRGQLAIITMAQLISPQRYKTALKALKGSKRERLEALASKLPPRYELILIQEPRHTRKSRSLAWRRGQDIPAVQAQPAPQPAPQPRYNGFQYGVVMQQGNPFGRRRG